MVAPVAFNSMSRAGSPQIVASSPSPSANYSQGSPCQGSDQDDAFGWTGNTTKLLGLAGLSHVLGTILAVPAAWDKYGGSPEELRAQRLQKIARVPEVILHWAVVVPLAELLSRPLESFIRAFTTTEDDKAKGLAQVTGAVFSIVFTTFMQEIVRSRYLNPWIVTRLRNFKPLEDISYRRGTLLEALKSRRARD